MVAQRLSGDQGFSDVLLRRAKIADPDLRSGQLMQQPRRAGRCQRPAVLVTVRAGDIC